MNVRKRLLKCVAANFKVVRKDVQMSVTIEQKNVGTKRVAVLEAMVPESFWTQNVNKRNRKIR